MVSYVTDILREIAINIALLIARLIGVLYDVIISLGTTEILKQDFFKDFAGRIGLLLGVYMLFRLIFALVTYLIDPDKISDKKEGAGKIVIRILVVIVLLASYNAIFKSLYTFQSTVLNSDFIPGLFFDETGTDENFIKNGGKFALQYSGILSSITESENNKSFEIPTAEELANFYLQGQELHFGVVIRLAVIAKASDIGNAFPAASTAFPFLNFMTPLIDAAKLGAGYAVEFNVIPCLLFTGFICYTMFVYVIKIAVRVSQLAFMQIIAPVPIVSYLDPKDESLKTWTKMTVSCYIEVFVRMAIFYLIAYVCYQIAYVDINIGTTTYGTVWIVKLMVMCGLLIFANKFPDILKKIFKLEGETYGLSMKKALGPVYKPLDKGTAGISGGVAAGIGAGLSGGKGMDIATAVLKGSTAGFKSGKAFAAIGAGFASGRNIGLGRASAENELGVEIPEADIAAARRAITLGQPTAAEMDKYETDDYASINSYVSAMDDIAHAGFVKTFYENNADAAGIKTVTDLMAQARLESTIGESTEAYDKLNAIATSQDHQYKDLAAQAIAEHTADMKKVNKSIYQQLEYAREKSIDIKKKQYADIVVDGEVVNNFGDIKSASDVSRIKTNSKLSKIAKENSKQVKINKAADKRARDQHKEMGGTAMFSMFGSHGVPRNRR